jgi:hypothetical protein
MFIRRKKPTASNVVSERQRLASWLSRDKLLPCRRGGLAQAQACR